MSAKDRELRGPVKVLSESTLQGSGSDKPPCSHWKASGLPVWKSLAEAIRSLGSLGCIVESIITFFSHFLEHPIFLEG